MLRLEDLVPRDIDENQSGHVEVEVARNFLRKDKSAPAETRILSFRTHNPSSA